MCKRILLVLFASVLFCSCISVSKNEQNAVFDIIKLWGGKCDISKKDTKDEQGISQNTLTLNLHSPNIFQNNFITQELVASNMALTMYTHWDDEEKSKYDNIRCFVDKGTGDDKTTAEYDYDLGKLKLAVSNENYFHYCADQIKSSQFNALFERFDSAVVTKDKETGFTYSFDTLTTHLREKNGPFYKDSLLGFSFVSFPVKGKPPLKLLCYYGLVMDKRSSAKLSIAVLPGKSFDEQFLYALNLIP